MPKPRIPPRSFRWLSLALVLLLAAPARRVSSAEPATQPGAVPSDVISTNGIATNAVAPRVQSPRPARTSSSISGDLYISDFGSVDSAEAALVVFVLAGAIVVSAALLYSGALLANLILQPDEVEKWAEITPRAQFFSGGYQQGAMTGAALSLGLADDEAEVGLVIEGGYLDADVITVDKTEVEVAGGYGMGGLAIRWPFDSGSDATAVEAELLVGSANQYDLISRASLALSWSIHGPWRAGLRVGALYLDVEEGEGPVWEAGEDFNLLGGVETSIRF